MVDHDEFTFKKKESIKEEQSLEQNEADELVSPKLELTKIVLEEKWIEPIIDHGEKMKLKISKSLKHVGLFE